MNITEAQLAIRTANRARTVADMRDGRRQIATFIAPRKGKGSYTRNIKHRGAGE